MSLPKSRRQCTFKLQRVLSAFPVERLPELLPEELLREVAKNLAKHLIGSQGGKACQIPIRKDVLTGRHKADLSRKDRLLFRRKSHGHSYKVVGQ